MKKVFFLIIGAIFFLFIHSSVHAATLWTERQPAGNTNKDWYTADTDSDGSFYIVGAWGGRLYTSSDGGVNWAERRPAGDVAGNWIYAASDSDGSNLIVAAYGGRLYTSSDGGVNWTERRPAGDANKDWIPTASDSDGSNLLAAVQNGRVYTSPDYGVSWLERQPAGDVGKNWNSGASDSDGSHIAVGVWGGRLYTSSDGGVNWAERRPGGDSDYNWNTISYSDDGQIIVAGVFGGRVYISTDEGETWTEIFPDGDSSYDWSMASCDATCTKIIVNAYVGRVYVSLDGGDSWTETQPVGDVNKSWRSVASDATGSHLISVSENGRIYTALVTSPPSISSYSPADDEDGTLVDISPSIIFSDNVYVGIGNIYIKKYLDDSIVETIDIASVQVTGDGTDTITIDPQVDFDESTEYYVQIDAGALKNATDDDFSGILDKDTWNFTTGDFTSPSGCSIIIASSASAVNTRTVTLTLSAVGANEMMISNSISFDEATWESYSTEHSWLLTDTDGQKIVYAKFRDLSENVSETVSDSIILKTETSTEVDLTGFDYEESTNDYSTLVGDVTFGGISEPGSTIHILVTKEGSVEFEITIDPDIDGNWEIDLGAVLGAGTYNIEITSTDYLGNEASSGFVLSVVDTPEEGNDEDNDNNGNEGSLIETGSPINKTVLIGILMIFMVIFHPYAKKLIHFLK